MKDSYPLQVAEYVARNQIISDSAFAWWCPLYLRKRKAILMKVKTRYWRRTHKYGVEIPKTVAKAKALDEKNSNRLIWQDAVEKEMRNNAIAFHFLENQEDGTHLRGRREVIQADSSLYGIRCQARHGVYQEGSVGG